MKTTAFALATAALVAPLAPAQSPASLRVPAALQLGAGGAPLAYQVGGSPNRPFAVLLDVHGGPREVLGETIWLGLTPALETLDAGTLDARGLGGNTLTVPGSPLLVGVPFFAQAAVLDPSAQNGIFRASNGESVVFYSSSTALVERFDYPVGTGLTGNYDKTILGRLQAGPLRRRTHSTIDPQGVPFGAPILTPLDPQGSRAQMVFRPVDLGATGEEELVTAIRWKPYAGIPLRADVFTGFTLQLVHSTVTPDYTIDPFTALPKYPASGLDPQFTQNYKAGEIPRQVFQGTYVIRPSALRRDGYLPYPAPAVPFAYNGADSLLVELLLAPSPMSAGLNGQSVRLMALSSPEPNARVAVQTPSPAQTPVGKGDNAMYDYQLEFLRVKTFALSLWLRGGLSADYHAPVAAMSLPPRTSVTLDYRGADDAAGRNATAWSRSVDVADGHSHVQYRATLTADPASGAVPSIDTLVIPVN